MEAKILGKVTNCSIGKNCKIDGFVKNSIIGDNVTIHKDALVEDSIIGDNVEFGGMIKTSEKAEIKIKDQIIELENFGAVIGDNSKLTGVLIHSGTMVWPNITKKDKELKGIVKK